MRTFLKLSAFALSAGLSRVVLAQVAPYSYTVSWGSIPVPISPWLSVAIGLMLLIATYAFMRRRAGQGLFMLATATLVGGLSLYTGNSAEAIAAYSISTPSGSDNYICGTTPYGGYVNHTGNIVVLTVTPLNGGPTSTSSNICHTGTQLAPNGGFCSMPCVE